MNSRKKELIRDFVLIGILLLIVGIAFILYYALKEEGEIAIVTYNNQELFQVELDSGKFTANTLSYEVTTLPVIIGEDLVIAELVFTSLSEGSGVVVFKDETNSKDYYFVKGNLGYVKIYYNSVTKKMKVVEETSPYNTCSKQGESNDVPIVCLPNFVTIRFKKLVLDDVV